MKTVPDMLREAAAVYEERNTLYSDNYKRFGSYLAHMFPSGIMVETPDDWNRVGLFMHIMTKVSRYAENWDRGGHDDSLQDLVVYATMLREIDRDIRIREGAAKVQKSREPLYGRTDGSLYQSDDGGESWYEIDESDFQ
jgi:hypothetical protein